MSISITRKVDETFPEYQFRLYENRVDYGLSNLQVAELLNKENGTNYDESKFRKEYQIFKSIWEPMFKKQHSATLPEEFAEEFAREQLKMNEKNRALTKMLQDQRREYRKQLDFSGRFEHIREEISATVQALDFVPSYPAKDVTTGNEKELIVLMSDWHYGTEVKSSRNKVTCLTIEERVRYYLEETLKEIKNQNIDTVTLANIGDMIGGIIHISSRVVAEEDAVQQIFGVTELLAEFISSVADVVPNVRYINIVGNHGRVIANKDAAMQEENFEKMILWYLKARLSNYTNIEYFEDEDGLVEMEILGEKVIFAHGDLDRQVSGADKLAQMLGYVPIYVFLGHTHHNFEKSSGTTTTIVNPSLIGGDSYSIAGRFGIQAAQKLVTFEKSKFGVIHTVKTIKLN